MPTVPDSNSPQMPPELVGKTLKQLKELGATEIGHIDINSRGGTKGMKPQTFSLSSEGEQKSRESLKELEEEADDPNYFTEHLGVESERF